MAEESAAPVCLCPHCLTPATEPGLCDVCGHTRLVCRPGDPNDPCRKPLMTAGGEVVTRAPLWWLKLTVGRLAEQAAKAAKE